MGSNGESNSRRFCKKKKKKKYKKKKKNSKKKKKKKEEENEEGSVIVGITAVVKFKLKDGTYHENIGYGISHDKNKLIAKENAKKEAINDAHKRAMKLFGDPKGYESHSTKISQRKKKAVKKKNFSENGFSKKKNSPAFSRSPSFSPSPPRNLVVPLKTPGQEINKKMKTDQKN